MKSDKLKFTSSLILVSIREFMLPWINVVLVVYISDGDAFKRLVSFEFTTASVATVSTAMLPEVVETTCVVVAIKELASLMYALIVISVLAIS